MQHDYPLTLRSVLERMRTVYPNSEVVTLREPGRTERATYGEVAARVDHLAAALKRLGAQPGDRIATLMWNSQEHLELYYAIPSVGSVLHTLNLRLHPDQLVYIINHAADRIIFVDDSLVPLLADIRAQLTTVEQVVVVRREASTELPDALDYEELLTTASPRFVYPEIDDRSASSLCYTSGTTGNPKGVLYSHRSSVLHALASGLADTFGIRASDRVLPVVPMFHVNAWGLPYTCGLLGADLVMPSRFLTAEALTGLIEQEGVTVSAGVPTIWLDVLRYADEHHPDLSSLRVVPCGGAPVPQSLMRAFLERHDVRIVQAWGMTETSPLASYALPPDGISGDEEWRYRSTGGRILPLLELRIVDDDGRALPWDGERTGEIQLRGPWIAAKYYESDDPEKFDNGWLRTGDIAAVEPGGFIRITDRTKDVIKSGGEWISSVQLESELMAHPAVAEAAVIARPDERWSERPLACVVVAPDASVSAGDLVAFLSGRVAKWWIPEQFTFLDEVPKTSVGKFDKKVLRARLAEGRLDVVEVDHVAPATP